MKHALSTLLLSALTSVALSGCTICQTHPKSCALAGVLVVSSLARGHSKPASPHSVTVQPVTCTGLCAQ